MAHTIQTIAQCAWHIIVHNSFVQCFSFYFALDQSHWFGIVTILR